MRWKRKSFSYQYGVVFSFHEKNYSTFKILIFVLLLSCLGFSQNTLSSNAELKISLEKTEYIVAEPIFLKVVFINLSDSIAKLDPIDLQWSVQLFNEDNYKMPHFGWRWDKVTRHEVMPFDTVTAEINLLEDFGTGFKHEGITKKGFKHLKIGAYKVNCKVLGIESNSIIVTVSNSNNPILDDYLEISRKEAEINTKYRGATNQERKTLFFEYQKMVDSFIKKHSDSRYAEAVLFDFLVDCSLGAAHLLNLDYRDEVHKYYRLYPNSPYSSKLVGHEWALLLKTMNQEQAVAEIKKIRTEHPSLRKRIDYLKSKTNNNAVEK